MITHADRFSGRHVRQAWRRLVDAAAPPPVILMYHRIAQDALDPWKLCVSPSNFAAQMEVIRRRRRPMRLADLTEALENGKCPRGAVVITFDDGYRDNLLAALPVLQAFDVPATVFCTAGYVGREQAFWWDRLAALLLHPRPLPDALALDVGGQRWSASLGEAAHYEAAVRACDRLGPSDGDGDGDRASPRLCFYRDLWAWLRPLSETDCALALERIAEWSGGAGDADDEPAPLSHPQLVTLAASPLIEIGAHSVTHAALPALTPAEQRREIGQSKAQLQDLVGRPVMHFAYPFGDQCADTAALVREAGFRSSCTTEADVVRAGTDLFHLPRVAIGDWDGDMFAKSLRGLL